MITWSKFSGEPPGWSEAEEPVLGEEAEGHSLVQMEEELMSSLPQYLWRGDRDDEARLFTVVYNRRMRDYRQKLKQEVLTRYKEKILHYEDDLALEQVIQTGCGIFVLSSFQDLAEQIPQQPGLNSEWTLL